MLIDKVIQEDGTIECLYKSSNILCSEWNEKSRKLTITFNYGGKYSYYDVDPKDYLRLEIDESQGKVFSDYIKRYKTEKLGKVDTTVLKESVERIMNERR